MKFLACSRCFSVDNPAGGRPVQEITNPLVVTKRPVPKVLPQPRASPPTRKKRLPNLWRSITSWPRRRQPVSPAKNVRKTVRVIEPPNRRRSRRPATRTQRLIRMYEERATSARHQEFLIDPPAKFDDSLESHQNFRNKLNTLDFKRMNTVALAEPSTSKTTECPIYGKNSYEGSSSPVSKFARKTLLEDFLKERNRIEQTMIDLLNGQDPGSVILAKTKNEDKKVRFSDEQELRLDVAADKQVELKDDGTVQRETEIRLHIEPSAKIEDFYVERTTSYLPDKTVEDKAVVLKIAPVDELELQEARTGKRATRQARDLVFRNFGKMTL